MTALELRAAVAEATGETLSTVRRRGFHLAESSMPCDDRDAPLSVIDCPCCGGAVVLAWDELASLPQLAECRRCDTAFGYGEHEVYATTLNEVTLSPARTYLTSAA